MAPMPPRTRRRDVSKNVARKPRAAPKQLTRARDEHSEMRDSDIENEDPVDGTSYSKQLAVAQADPLETLQALSEMTEKLGKDVETFAVALDRFFDEKSRLDSIEQLYDLSHDLTSQLCEEINAHVEELEKEVQDRHSVLLAKEWLDQAHLSSSGQKSSALTIASRSVLQPSIGPAELAELRQYQEESSTWTLFRQMLELRYGQEENTRDPAEILASINRYTPETVIFDHFLEQDHQAREYHFLKIWFEQTARTEYSAAETIVKELEKTWQTAPQTTRGWLHTREKIKSEKRLRTWPAPDSSPLPQIRSVDSNELIVTALDPDATGRQHRTLEKQDAYHERISWVACWQLLRQGHTWSEIVSWFESRREGWLPCLLQRDTENSTSLSSAVWARTCYRASTLPDIDEYEAAVYGYLGGNDAAMQKVCHTVDDQLWAFYTVAITRSFDQFLLKHFPERRLRHEAASQSHAEAQESLAGLIKKLRTRSDTKNESRTAIKIIQSYLLSRRTEDLIHTLGMLLPMLSAQDEWKSLLVDGSADGVDLREHLNDPETVVLQDPVGLRMITHILIVLRSVRIAVEADEVTDNERAMEDNLIVSYIKQLLIAGKRDLIPLYASLLQPERCTMVMAHVLPNVHDQREMQEIMTLLEQKGIPVVPILDTQLELMLRNVAAEAGQVDNFSIMRPTKDNLWPGQQIALQEATDATSPAQNALIDGLMWYILLPRAWASTFAASSMALRTALVSGSFACARLIIEQNSARTMSLNKTGQILGTSIDIFDEEQSLPANAGKRAQWIAMQKQAATYVQLEQLITAFEALFAWRTQESLYLSKVPRPATVPKELKEAVVIVQEAMKPLLRPTGFLLDPYDEAEAKDLALIREVYLTDAIIAYNTTLYSAAAMITRDHLLASMDLATIVAGDESQLTQTFARSGRLQELVTSFAYSSRQILIMKQQGRAWRPTHEKRTGKTAAIWDVGAQAYEVVNGHALASS